LNPELPERERLQSDLERLRARFPAHPNRYLYVLVAVGAVDAADRTILSTVFEDVKRAFDVSDAKLGLLVAAYSVVATLSLIPFGWAADRYSRVRLIALGFVPWSIAMVWTGAASSFAMMFVARLFLGSIEATNGPSTPSLLGDYYPVSRRSRMFGTAAVGGLVGTVTGLAAGGVIASLAGWRMAFFVWGGLGFVCAAVVVRILPEPERGLPDAISHLETQVAAFDGRHEPRVVVAPAPAYAASADRPVDHDYRQLSIREAARQIVKVKTMWIVFVSGAVSEFTMSGLGVWAPTFFRRYYGLNAAAAGSLVALLAMSTVGGIMTGARLGDRAFARDPTARIRIAGVASMASFGALFIAFRFDSLPLVIPSFVAAGFLVGVPMAPLGAVGLDVLVPQLRGRASAVRSVLRVGGTAAAPLLFGYLSDRHGLRSALLLTMPAIFFAGVIVLLAAWTYVADMGHAQAEALRQHTLQDAELENLE
jgi:MFS family permease